tara:strand:+ start:737 stop:901 length:165 start_codon:yes stop_codon:yes gene_type:complete
MTDVRRIIEGAGTHVAYAQSKLVMMRVKETGSRASVNETIRRLKLALELLEKIP